MTKRSTRAASLLAAVALTGAAAIQAQPRFNFDTTPGALSKQVVPSLYALTLNLDPAHDEFTGQVTSSVKLRQGAAFIDLHAHELKASRATLATAGASRPLQVTAQEATQTWRLTPTDGAPIAAGEHRIEIAYGGNVHAYGEGLYRAPYESNGKPQRMLATQLEAIYARTVFPGFDEPSFRAAFELTVRAPKEFEVLSNMPHGRTRVEGATAIHAFPATPAMPTYLFSVAVGHFDLAEAQAAGVPLRIVTPPGKREEARFALAATQQILPYYTWYFGVPFALPKLDQLAVPSVRWGAMEDWGLISYAEDDILVDAKRSTERTRRQVYETLAHEIAHQWFGNLVTAASWEEIWLNEAFATWLQSKATDRFNPAWKIRLEDRQPIDRAMLLDAGTATRAIRSGPVRESAVNDVFDEITYAKGGSVLTMLEQWIGPDAFRNGLVAYMKGQRLSNATAGDLWHYIGEASGNDVSAVAASWTDQQGFPLVQVHEACDNGQAKVTLTQSRFSTSASAAAGQVWKIPVRMARGTTASTALFDTPEKTLSVGPCDKQPLIVNAGGAGFYRVAYEPSVLQLLTERFVKLAEGDRMALLSDTFALVQAGRVPLNSYFTLLAALPQVTDSSRTMLWGVAHTQLDFLDRSMIGSPAQQQVRAVGRSLLAPQLARLGWTPRRLEDAQTAELRAALIEALAKFDDPATIEHALRAFDEDDSGKAPLPPSMRRAVVVAAGTHADRPRFDKLMARLKKATAEEDRWMYAKALASGRDPKRAEEVLAASLTGIAPPNVATALPALVARSSPFGDLAYSYTLSNFKRLGDLAGTWGRSFLLPSAASAFNEPERASRLVEDQRREAGADGDVLAAREAEAIRLRAAVKAREAAGLEKALPG
jgi:aminopeptidase N